MDQNDANIWLTYQYGRFKFSFKEDYVLVYDKQYKREYKIQLNGEMNFPFEISLEKQD